MLTGLQSDQECHVLWGLGVIDAHLSPYPLGDLLIFQGVAQTSFQIYYS